MASETLSEIDAMGQIDAVLSAFSDQPDVQHRILRWACSKYDAEREEEREKLGSRAREGDRRGALPATEGEMPGIARVTESGEFVLTVRDIKAKHTNDAAVRLCLVTIYAYCKLTGTGAVSSRRVVKPVLERWRAYTGNTRAMLAAHMGIIREGDNLSLDKHAEKEAEDIIAEILDESESGSWKPCGAGARSRRRK